MSISHTFAFAAEDLTKIIGDNNMIVDLVFSEIVMKHGVKAAPAIVVIHREDLIVSINKTIQDVSQDIARQSREYDDAETLVILSQSLVEATEALQAVKLTDAQYFFITN